MSDDAMNPHVFWAVPLADFERPPVTETVLGVHFAPVRTIESAQIIENYFKILGGVDPDGICAMFGGKEKMICKSLFSWVHAGSHHALDDLYMSIDDAAVDAYLNVFKSIFDKSGHFAHYEMMMGDSFVEDTAAAPAS